MTQIQTETKTETQTDPEPVAPPPNLVQRETHNFTISETGMFRSLRNHNYRLWAAGALVSNIGTWMQRIAQDWLVLTQLTPHNAMAVGVVMSLQFGPQVLLLPLTGYAADRMDLRKLLLITQVAMGLLALGLGILTVTGTVQLWHVYAFAFGLGCVSAFDSPARQTFVSEIVGDADLANAVALNSTSFNAARMVGPALAGILIAKIGSGWMFILNSLSFAALIAALYMLRSNELHVRVIDSKVRGTLTDGFKYAARRADLMAIFVMYFLIGTFAFNFPLFISTMAVTAFHSGAEQFGLLTSLLAVGSVAGALLSARRLEPNISILHISSLVLGVGCAAAALMPSYLLFGVMLIAIGMAAQSFTTTANGMVQLSTDPHVRGRVMAILLAISAGGTPIGAPIVGWIADSFGPRWALCVGAVAAVAAAAVCAEYLKRHRDEHDTDSSVRPLSITIDTPCLEKA